MEYMIIEGSEQMDVSEVERLLKTTYWANSRTAEQIEKSMRNSACFGIRSDKTQQLIGFARVITDYATTWYLCDVIIDCKVFRAAGPAADPGRPRTVCAIRVCLCPRQGDDEKSPMKEKAGESK